MGLQPLGSTHSPFPPTHTHTHTPVDETVAEVYKDFEVAAIVDPERMKRRSTASFDSVSVASQGSK